MALLVVLWIFIFLFVVAFDFSTSVREEAAAAGRYGDETQGYYLAVAGFEQGVYDFLGQTGAQAQQAAASAQPGQASGELFDGSWREEKLGAGIYRVRLIDEGGKVNVNRADEVLLRRVFTNIGIEEPRRSVLVDSILDWRDPDDLHRTNGAESDYYLTLRPPYTAKNGPFDSVEDLLWVRGMTSELFYGRPKRADDAENPMPALREIFTVDGPIDRVNLRTASAEVISAVTGISPEKSRRFVEERKKLSEKTLADLLPLLGVGSGDSAMQGFVFANPTVISVEAEGRPAESQVFRRVRGIVRLGGQQGFEILRWIDREWGYRKHES